ncbi:MAG TPA: SDR family NAD(P)-dependent oxidoreductase, partial [Candidatus Limnocylindrales bacterium]|nr:SDR family NAD(P)-dependent oxidoreductase [Candidatus Limnocylindrales bacterium]
VTGGASGIGRATAHRLVADGVAVVVGDIQDETGEAAAAEFRATGGSASYVHLDVADETSWQQAVSAIEREHGRLDILVNNAGIGDVEPLEQTSLETYSRVVAITQTSVFLGMKATAELLKQSGAGAVVNVSSIFGIVGGFGVSPGYAAAKGAVRTLTKNVALLWATQGVRVNSVHPGFIDTAILGEADRETLVDVTPMRRLGTPAEVAEAIVFLASPAASFITGAELWVDGGYLAR